MILFFAPHAFPAFFTSIARPFWRVEFSIANGSLTSPEQLQMKNVELSNKIAQMEVDLRATDHIRAENNMFKVLLGRRATSQELMASSSTLTENDSEYVDPIFSGRILSAVLRRPPMTAYDQLIIDIGTDHGVSTSSLVYAPGNVLIGRIVDVLKNTSRVVLFSSPGESYDVFIGANDVAATAIGRGAGQYEAQVSLGSGVMEGDLVANPGLQENPFGVVTSVSSDPTQPFETIFFAPFVNIFQLRWVTVTR